MGMDSWGSWEICPRLICLWAPQWSSLSHPSTTGSPSLAGQLLPRISCLMAERRNALSALYGPNQPRAGRQPLPLWGLAVSNGGVWSARNEGVEFLCPPGAHTCQAPLSDIHRALCSPPAFLLSLDWGSLFINPNKNTCFSESDALPLSGSSKFSKSFGFLN